MPSSILLVPTPAEQFTVRSFKPTVCEALDEVRLTLRPTDTALTAVYVQPKQVHHLPVSNLMHSIAQWGADYVLNEMEQQGFSRIQILRKQLQNRLDRAQGKTAR